MKSMRSTLAAIFFMTNFYSTPPPCWIRNWGRGSVKIWLRRSATWQVLSCGLHFGFCFFFLTALNILDTVPQGCLAIGHITFHCYKYLTKLTCKNWTYLILSYGEAKMKRGQDIQLSICSYVAEKPCGCLYKLTCCNAKFHSLFKCKLYLWINFIYHSKVLE